MRLGVEARVVEIDEGWASAGGTSCIAAWPKSARGSRRSRRRRGEINAVAQRRPQQAARTRAAVIPLQTGPGRAGLLRLLPSGRSLLVGFAIVLGAAGLYVVARVTPMFALQRIEVQGASPALAARVRAALEPLHGKSLLALDGAQVEQRLNSLTSVASGSYDRAFPRTLRVVVRPERPVAIARHGADAWVVAASARVLAPSAPHARRDLPRIWLNSDPPRVGAGVTDRFGLRAVRALSLAGKVRLPSRIRTVQAHDHELTFLLASGLELRLGDLHAIRLKLAVAARILPGLRGYGYLDVSVPGRPVAGDRNPQLAG
jgi:cell division septal protein FtsQ